ncbi:myo-inosose-2 dehydratase [Lichenibacterium minor]|uniref:Myo-inosose-2 dehydratase n=1 Tax=Lichenibacterium minor TaxID=2316528 RepID=A0A4V1RTY3_9HYPH|nr:myo-inosose-2 dehydratase [Lichenibacterium minor]RYC29254.1 myo-inosose-2 dehydratase [Lichenibacterium minor]
MPAETASWRLGVSPLSWTNDVLEDLGDDTPVARCVDEAAAAGYAGVELGRKFPREPKALAELLSPRGLVLASGWHSGFLAERGVEEEMVAVAPHARLLNALGASVMVYGECGCMVAGSPLDAPMSRRLILAGADLDTYARRLQDFAGRLAAEHGLTLAYHHHLMMVAETFDEVSSLLDRTGPAVGLLLDTGHAVAAGFEYARLIDRFGDRIVHVHLKDVRPEVMSEVRRGDLSFNAGVRAGMFTVPGDGSVDFGPLARFVADTGYRGWLVVEAEQDPEVAPPLAAVTRARACVLSHLS